ncbi:MAG: adenylyltransferase/cytidyltransferase family protein, partial [Burkholderiales bacterium]|nr:adenylyltransferase/cytidyltransferase family protein [Burkholderiales bacterium]
MPDEAAAKPAPPPAFERKLCPPEQAAARAARLEAPVVFTNGCFDLLHRGHVTYLAQARALGASLVVALNSDESVRRLGKGDDRPVNTLADRMAVMAALECVDLVTWFDADTPLDLVVAVRPQVLVKGG